MNRKYLDWIIESLQSLIVFILFTFHILRSHRIKKGRDSTDESCSFSLLRIIKLKHVSYLILSVYLLKGLFNLIKSMLDLITSDISYNDNICTMFQNIDVTLGIIGRFGIHLFVALRSRLSSTKQKLSIWFKIGLLLILTDIGLILFPWIINVLHAKYLNGICVLTAYDPILLSWILFSDFVIGIYCLFVFVLPIKEILKWEKKTTTTTMHNYSSSNFSINNYKVTKISNCNNSMPAFSPTINSNSSASKSKSKSDRYQNKEIARDRSLEELVHKIILFSSIMLISSMLVMVIALILSISQFKNTIILSLLPPIDNILNSWCIILQFADIRIDSIQSIYGRIIISFFQCNYCNKQCFCYFCNNNNNNNNNIMFHKKQSMESNISNISIDVMAIPPNQQKEENKLNDLNQITPLQIDGELADEDLMIISNHLAITPADSTIRDVQSTQYLE